MANPGDRESLLKAIDFIKDMAEVVDTFPDGEEGMQAAAEHFEKKFTDMSFNDKVELATSLVYVLQIAKATFQVVKAACVHSMKTNPVVRDHVMSTIDPIATMAKMMSDPMAREFARTIMQAGDL